MTQSPFSTEIAATHRSRPELAATLAPRYRLERPLGAGGMAEVWEGVDTLLGRKVAVKFVRRELAGSDAARERFRREAQLGAGLAHENVLQVFDYAEVEGGACLVLELAEGLSLREHLTARGPVPAAVAVALAHEVARGLAHAHARGVVHRDVKPDNLLVGSSGALKLADLGVAALAVRTPFPAAEPVVGSPAYMAPEQIAGAAPEPGMDVFALGVVLHELLTGAVPFDGGTPEATMALIRVWRYAPPEAAEAAGLGPLLRQALCRDPAARFADGAELQHALRAWLSARGINDPRAVAAAWLGHPAPAARGAETRAETLALPPPEPPRLARRVASALRRLRRAG